MTEVALRLTLKWFGQGSLRKGSSGAKEGSRLSPNTLSVYSAGHCSAKEGSCLSPTTLSVYSAAQGCRQPYTGESLPDRLSWPLLGTLSCTLLVSQGLSAKNPHGYSLPNHTKYLFLLFKEVRWLGLEPEATVICPLYIGVVTVTVGKCKEIQHLPKQNQPPRPPLPNSLHFPM